MRPHSTQVHVLHTVLSAQLHVLSWSDRHSLIIYDLLTHKSSVLCVV